MRVYSTAVAVLIFLMTSVMPMINGNIELSV